MHRFSPALGSLVLLALSLPTPVFAQAKPGDGATAPSGPDSNPQAPASPTTGNGSAPPSTSTTGNVAPPATAPAAPATAPPQGPAVTIDRSSLLAPAPVQRTPSATPAAPTDAKDLDRRTDAVVGTNPKTVYAEDWWVHSRPVFELHGLLRVRAELFHLFSLGRFDAPDNALWPQPADNDYVDTGSVPRTVRLCGPSLKAPCEDKSQAGANMRFRLNPELHVSDNLRIVSQIDMLDNLVLGSTPGGYNGSSSTERLPSTSPYAPIGAFASTQVPPTAGQNSFKNSINIKRAWGEYATPVGQLRFGRMPNHWGLGILENSGDGYDSDWQSTIDRIMFTTGIKPLDLYFTGAWDFPNEGQTSASLENTLGGQPYDLAQLDDVNQYTAMIARRRNPELTKLDLARGDVVLNGGVYFQYRDQLLASENVALGATAAEIQAGDRYVRRGLRQYTPDAWFQLLYKKFRFEVEGTMVAGSVQSALLGGGGDSYDIRQFGLATQTEWKAVEDRLRLQFGFGWSSGDSGLEPDNRNRSSSLSPTRSGAQGILSPRVGNRTFSQFRFNPDYRIDLILHRNILSRVQGDYYFRPSVEYDFTRSAEGQKLGGSAAVIWTRASEFVQTPGHKRDLGIELNAGIYYQSKDGSRNDDPHKMGGFFTMIQYGVLFPMGGLGYRLGETGPETSSAHTVRWFMGVLF